MKKLYRLLIFIIAVSLSLEPAFSKEAIKNKSAYINERKALFLSHFGKDYKSYPIFLNTECLIYPNPQDFYMAFFKNEKLIFLYTNSLYFYTKDLKMKTDKSINDFKSNLIKSYNINNSYIIDDPSIGSEYDVVDKGFYYIIIFYDNKEKIPMINGILFVDKNFWHDFLLNKLINYQPNKTEDYFEEISFLHLNACRWFYSKSILAFSKTAQKTARKHSSNMAKFGFFGHVDKSGLNFDQRLLNDGVNWSKCAENIAYGTNLLPIFANHYWLNSKGHRENMLNQFEYVGVGCAFNLQKKYIFYTHDFYSQK